MDNIVDELRNEIIILQQKISTLEAEKTKLEQYEKSKLFTPNEWYRYWRSALKEQATSASGVFFLFSAACIGYIINGHSTKNNCETLYTLFNCNERMAIIFMAIGLFFYGLLSISRFYDYRKKAEKHFNNKDLLTVLKETNWIKNFSLFFFIGQILLFGIGFSFLMKDIYNKFF